MKKRKWIGLSLGICLLATGCAAKPEQQIEQEPIQEQEIEMEQEQNQNQEPVLEEKHVVLSEFAKRYLEMDYGTFKAETGSSAKWFHADRFVGQVPKTTIFVTYTGMYDEEMMIQEPSDDVLPLRLEGPLGELFSGVQEEIDVFEFAKQLSEDAVCEIKEGAGTAYYIGDRYAEIILDDEYGLMITLDRVVDQTVTSGTIAWLEKR